MTERAVLAGGCFWGMQDLIRKLPGVIDTRVGYTGGDVKFASYRNHGTHAEGIEVIFDPAKMSYRQLLEFFFQIHDPTTLNRQGNDVGTQYRSGIYYDNPEHGEIANAMIRQMSQDKLFGAPITTEVKPLQNYSTAEAYHQDYFANHPNAGYCAFVVGPKVEKFRKTFARYLKG